MSHYQSQITSLVQDSTQIHVRHILTDNWRMLGTCM